MTINDKSAGGYLVLTLVKVNILKYNFMKYSRLPQKANKVPALS